MNNLILDSSWTLFLDRDGVINKEKEGDYIRNLDEFEFLPGALYSLQQITPRFLRSVVVTNQRGIGKGLMQTHDLVSIHNYLQHQVEAGGGQLDVLLYAPDLDADAPNRKPNPGMAWQAKQLFPEIDFNKSIMVGNRLSDMEFGRNCGMTTVYLYTTHPLENGIQHPLIDYYLADLPAFEQLVLKSFTNDSLQPE
ncbi:MAG: HAD-IIIA family hydrolase [Chitinophagaceae bacterium]|nr:HAD-IIIA family hydrolase [Chitinophagaceae bacterium]